MVPHHRQQLRFVLTVPRTDRTSSRGAFRFEASPTDKDECSREESCCKRRSVKVKIKNCQTECKDKGEVANAINLSQRNLFGAGLILHSTLFQVTFSVLLSSELTVL